MRGQSLHDWCLENGDFGQQLLREWDTDKNKEIGLTIDNVTYGSHNKALWKCSKEHEWCADIHQRTYNKSRCPYCYNKNKSKSLRDWCLENGDFGQQLLAEWDTEKNNELKLNINNISYGSGEKAWWKCCKGHKWNTAINYRTYSKTQCIHCNNERLYKLKRGKKTLQEWCSYNGDFGQQLLKEWNTEKNSEIGLAVTDVSYGSKKEVWWTCNNGHIWCDTIYNRVINKRECIHCKTQTLYDWCIKNGEFGQQLLKEWTGIDELNTDNIKFETSNVTYGANKKFKWICSKGHEWIATVHSRTGNRTCCPYCNTYSTSYPEQFIYWSLKQIYPNTENRCRVLKSSEHPHGIEFDIGVPDIPLCVEYSSDYWHEGKEDNDLLKEQICKEHNIRLIQIIESGYIEHDYKIVSTNMVYVSKKKTDETLSQIVDIILNQYNHSINEIDIEKIKQNAWEYSHGAVEYEKSLEYNYPELVKEWNSTLNENMTPENITVGSNKNIYWTCTKCGYGNNKEWCASIVSRTQRLHGCPNCGYNCFSDKYNMLSKCSTGINDLQHMYKELSKEYSTVFNKLDAYQVASNSNKRVYWTCTCCGYGKDGEWYIEPTKRVWNKSGCPNCGYNWYRAQIGEPQKFKKKYLESLNESSQKMLPINRTGGTPNE